MLERRERERKKERFYVYSQEFKVWNYSDGESATLCKNKARRWESEQETLANWDSMPWKRVCDQKYIKRRSLWNESFFVAEMKARYEVL